MSWTWRYRRSADSAGSAEGDDQSHAFASQADAETWIGETWRDLLTDGVDAVFLYEDGREVYGPMSLHPAE